MKQHDSTARKNWTVRQNVLDAVNELIDELDGIQQQISEQALEHVHSNEVILTFGSCRSVHLFLREAAKKRRFQVVVAEGAPGYEGQKLARELATDGVPTTCITDSAVFAMMARANMVLMGAHAVLANGGMLGQSGSHMVALAAARHAVPVVVLTGMHKLSPVFPHDEDTTLNDLGSPCDILDFDAIADSLSADGTGVGPDLHAVNPQLSYIPPHLISLFITNDGCAALMKQAALSQQHQTPDVCAPSCQVPLPVVRVQAADGDVQPGGLQFVAMRSERGRTDPVRGHGRGPREGHACARACVVVNTPHNRNGRHAA